MSGAQEIALYEVLNSLDSSQWPCPARRPWRYFVFRKISEQIKRLSIVIGGRDSIRVSASWVCRVYFSGR
jgi:hypothetical protein